jgi:hypothetical protein
LLLLAIVNMLPMITVVAAVVGKTYFIAGLQILS